MDLLSVRGNQIVDQRGNEVRLRGTCVGGWMNMEDFINAYPGAEHQLRSVMARELGAGKAQFFVGWLLEIGDWGSRQGSDGLVRVYPDVLGAS